MEYLLAVIIAAGLTIFINIFKIKEITQNQRRLKIIASGFALAVACVAAAYRYGLSLQFPVAIVFAACIIYIAMYDVLHKAVSTKLLVICAACALVVLPVNNDVTVKTALIYGVVLSCVFFIVSKISKNALGVGDAWIIGIIGLFCGSGAIFIISCAAALCALTSVILLLTKRAHKNTEIPFAPFLCAGVLAYLIF